MKDTKRIEVILNIDHKKNLWPKTRDVRDRPVDDGNMH